MGKVVSLAELKSLRAELAAQGKRLVLTNGCFDLLHVGHVRYLRHARALGDVLAVALNSDASARAIKGAGRPLVPEDDRAEILAALACVDYAFIFTEHTAEQVVAELRPDVYVKGGDYGDEPKAWPEAAIVRGYGGEVATLPFVEGKSTTALLETALKRLRRRRA